MFGLAGGVGSGKSTAAAVLGELGCAVIDGDAIGQELLDDPNVARQLRRRWGDRIFGPDGAVDRQALAAIVFQDHDELGRLNAILHPPIRRRMAERIAALASDAGAGAAVLDAAVLFEAGWDELCTHLVFIDAPGRDRRRRVAAQRGWDRRTWARREKSQISLDKKRRRCDYIINNSSSVPCLRERIRELFRNIVPDADHSW